jgi:hypothetical protein
MTHHGPCYIMRYVRDICLLSCETPTTFFAGDCTSLLFWLIRWEVRLLQCCVEPASWMGGGFDLELWGVHKAKEGATHSSTEQAVCKRGLVDFLWANQPSLQEQR